MAKKLNTMTVQRTEQLTPHMVRVYLGGPGFEEFTPVDDTDMYVKILFPPEGVRYPEPFDLERIREEFEPGQQPVLRTYTVRRVDTVAREVAIDFVVHGTEGLAGPWAASTQPGDVVRFLGPGSGYRPRADVDWHLLASDEAGLPALAAALESMPDGAVVKAFIEVAGPDDHVDIAAPDTAEITWLHRDGSSNEVGDDKAGANAPIVAAVKQAEWLPGTVQVFIHGEAEAVMHNLRAYVRKERGVPASHASISGYWRRGRTEEGFRQWKAELKKQEEAAGSAV